MSSKVDDTKLIEVMRVPVRNYGDNVFKFLNTIEEEALEVIKKNGYTNPSFEIVSTMESYEDYPGDPEVVVFAYCKMTKEEIEEEKLEKKLRGEAQKLGITFYEMKQLDNFRKRGIV